MIQRILSLVFLGSLCIVTLSCKLYWTIVCVSFKCMFYVYAHHLSVLSIIQRKDIKGNIFKSFKIQYKDDISFSLSLALSIFLSV